MEAPSSPPSAESPCPPTPENEASGSSSSCLDSGLVGASRGFAPGGTPRDVESDLVRRRDYLKTVEDTMATYPSEKRQRMLGHVDEEAEHALSEFQAHLRLNLARIEPLSRGPAEILPHLLLGSCDDAFNIQVLVDLGVTHVLNCASGSVKTGAGYYEPYGIQYSEFLSEDVQGYDIMQHYPMLAALADDVLNSGGRLFIHCEAGVNRSGTLCLAYHAATTGMPLLMSARQCKAAVAASVQTLASSGASSSGPSSAASACAEAPRVLRPGAPPPPGVRRLWQRTGCVFRFGPARMRACLCMPACLPACLP
eukprot:CAMPEP_0175684808 /NCGR_PEP_ID=MMETSP0097-20121207/27028_1 /TAXON_ID=311494 /ORGANISM="Alexandrium monilatum, Strain CCMP3105" /LENGTH=309 /DNA_ID=CAMNT_0016991749 /DNA_START=14 /DNA_END=940 /DNA_ORIENTATION=+